MTLKNDSSLQYLAVPADCFKLHYPLAPLLKNCGSMDIAVSCGAKWTRNAMHSLHKIARDCQANEDDTVTKESSLSTLS